jgi:hypothetical protein
MLKQGKHLASKRLLTFGTAQGTNKKRPITLTLWDADNYNQVVYSTNRLC